MSTPATFRFSMKDSTDTLWYYVDGAGNVQTSTSPKYLTDETGNQVVSPKEWKELRVGYMRNEKYHGVFREFGLPVSFTYDAAKILQHVFLTDGCDGNVIWIIDITDPYTNLPGELYRGTLDLTATDFKDAVKELFFKTNVDEIGLANSLKNKENIPQEFGFDGDSFTMYHDGTQLDMKYIFTSVYKLLDRTSTADYFLPAFEIKHDGEVDSLIVNSTGFGNLVDANNIYKNNVWVIPIYDITDCNIRFEWYGGLFNQSPSSSMKYIVQLHIFRNGDFTTPVNNATKTIFTSAAITTGNTGALGFTVDYPFDLQAGDYLCITAGVTDLGGGGIQYDIDITDGTRITVTGKYKLPASEIPAYRYPDFLSKLVKAAFGSSVNVVSNFFTANANYKANYDCHPKWTSVTSGSAIRQLTNPKIKTSFSDAFQDMRRWGIGVAVEGGNLRFEKLPYFYQHDRLVIELESISSFSYTSANKFLANQVHVGYNSKLKSDDVNGLQDFHTKNTFEFPLDKIQAEISWVSPYQASIFGIEYARAALYSKRGTVETNLDDDIYLIEVDGDPTTYNAGRPVLKRFSGAIYGLNSPSTAYNFGETPYCTFLHNKELLLAMAYGLPYRTGRPLTYKKTDKNNQVARHLDSIEIDEDASHSLLWFDNEPTGTPATPTGTAVIPLFQPIMIEIEAVVPSNLIDLMNSNYQNRYGVIRFPYGKGTLDMFINDIALAPETNDLYTIRGLSSPNNNWQTI